MMRAFTLCCLLLALGCSSVPKVEEKKNKPSEASQKTSESKNKQSNEKVEKENTPLDLGSDEKSEGEGVAGGEKTSNYRALKKALNESKDSEVLSEVSKILAENKKDLKTLNALAMHHYSKGRFGIAKTILKRAFETESESSILYNNLGLILLKENKVKEAIVSFEKSLVIEKDNLPSLRNLAGIYAYYRDYKRTAEIYEKLSVKSSLRNDEANNFAVSLSYLGQLEKASKIFERFYKKDPSVDFLFSYLVFLVYQKKNYKEASEVIRKIEIKKANKEYSQRVSLIKNFLSKQRLK